MKPRICLCLAGRTHEENLRTIERYRSAVDLVELRADYLDPGERFFIRDFPRKAGLPCILTIRRRADGGCFDDGEGVRLVLFAKALSYARSDSSANYAYVDLEDDFHIPVIEEACRTFGTRIIRSSHHLHGMPQNLDEAWNRITQEEDEIPRLAVRPSHSQELLAFLKWVLTLPPKDKLALALGPYGVMSSLLAWRLGSLWTYASSDRNSPLCCEEGFLDPFALRSIYRFDSIDDRTVLYSLVGQTSILASLSPYLHNTAFREMGKNALLIPTPVDEVEHAVRILEMIGGEGAAITVPFKEDVLPLLSFHSTDVKRIGACNTLVRREGSWAGYNTDADGFERSLVEFLDRQDLSGCRATIVGAGGAAKSVALALYRKKAQCLILNRTYSTARELARKYNFHYSHLDERAIDLISDFSDLIVQATSVGMNSTEDPLSFYEFTGKEAVFDLIYHPAKTRLLARAEAAGCRITNGYRMLCHQAAGQYKLWMNEPPPGIYAQLPQPE